MSNVIVGNIYRHRTFCYFNPQVGMNVRYFRVTTVSGTPSSEAAFNSAQDLIFAPLYKACLCNGASYVGSDIQNITGAAPYPIPIGTNANAGAGTAGAGALPGQVSGIYTTTTGTAGRGYRGRAYIPFPSTVDNVNGPPPTSSVGYQTRVTLIANLTVGSNNVTTGGTVTTIQWVIMHSLPLAIKGTTTDLQSFKVGLNWATQRRRGDFGRTNALPIP